MADNFQFELVTPEKLVLSEAIHMVEIPGEMGDFGVLPGHAPFFSMIRPGLINVHRDAQQSELYFVPSGYAEVNPQSCTVLAEQARRMAEVKRADVEAELRKAEDALDRAYDDAEKQLAQKQVQAAEALLLAIDQASHIK